MRREHSGAAVRAFACVLVAAGVLAACDGSSDDSESTAVADASTTQDGSEIPGDDSADDGSIATSPPSASVASDATPPPPVAAEAASTLKFLDGDGAPLLAMHRVALEWDDEVSVDDCDELGDQLDRDVPTDQATLLIAGVDDEPLEALLDAERIALHASLTACLEQTTVPDIGDVAALNEVVPLVEQRLDALEAAR